MPKSLSIYIAGLVTVGALALAITSLVIPVDGHIRLNVFESESLDIIAGIAFWTGLTLLASALPVRMPRGTLINTSIAPIVAAMTLGGPTAAGWVALLGTSEHRELSGQVPWYGTLANHAGLVIPAIAAGFARQAALTELARAGISGPAVDFASTLAGASVFFALNVSFTAVVVALRTNQSARSVMRGDLPTFIATWVALAPLAWLMAQIYRLQEVGWWATLFFALPVYIMRVALRQIIEVREMFTQTIGALAQAVDARDAFTSGHSERVQLISVDIGRVMRLKDAEIQALEWGGLLHDIGKIGVPDSVLLKQDKLTRDERVLMNRHPVIGANIIAHVGKLAPELPIIRHHHEWYNGSGYPDRLMGDEIPKLARVLHVADAFEAMTSARPYRMRPLSREQAIAELRKYAGVQFDPVMVDAFMRTAWARDAEDAGRPAEVRPVPLLAQAAARMVPPPAPDGSPADAS
jgi:HD-GYP domain-containing protein (c-di-GMP phosphodiesterase class II)